MRSGGCSLAVLNTAPPVVKVRYVATALLDVVAPTDDTPEAAHAAIEAQKRLGEEVLREGIEANDQRSSSTL